MLPPMTKEKGDEIFLKFKKDQAVTCIVKTENIYIYKMHWVNKDSKSYTCSEDDLCEICPEVAKDRSKRRKNRFKVCLFVFDEDTQTWSPRIWEQGEKVYGQIEEYASAYDLNKTPLKIIRRGEKTDTTYTIMPLLKMEVDWQQVEALELLDPKGKPKETPSV